MRHQTCHRIHKLVQVLGGPFGTFCQRYGFVSFDIAVPDGTLMLWGFKWNTGWDGGLSIYEFYFSQNVDREDHRVYAGSLSIYEFWIFFDLSILGLVRSTYLGYFSIYLSRVSFDLLNLDIFWSTYLRYISIYQNIDRLLT